MTAVREVPPQPGTRFSSILHLDQTGSTNADLIVEAGQGAPAGTVLVADHQTAGRGRQQRSWHDEPGAAVLMSVLLRPEPAVARLIPLVTGLAAIDGVAATVPGPTADRLGLKWPNDVVVPDQGDRKLAGILAEATSRPGSTELAVVVGMGLNLRWTSPPPAEIAARATTLEDLSGAAVDRWSLVRSVLVALESWLVQLERGAATEVLDAYRRRSITIGRDVIVERPDGSTLEGVAVDIDDAGALLVDPGSGPVTVLAGDTEHCR